MLSLPGWKIPNNGIIHPQEIKAKLPFTALVLAALGDFLPKNAVWRKGKKNTSTGKKPDKQSIQVI